MPRKFFIKRRRVLRNLQGKKIVKAPKGPELSVASRRIMEHPHYQELLVQLQRGGKVGSIVKWFDNEGWLGDMSPSTFSQYIYKFKNEHPLLLAKPPSQNESYDALIGVNIPEIDEDAELDKLILIQKRRISVDVATEVTMGKLLDTTHKEIGVLGELLKARRTMKRQINDGNTEGHNANDSTALRELRVSEDAADRMQGLTKALFDQVKNAKVKKTRPTQKVGVRA